MTQLIIKKNTIVMFLASLLIISGGINLSYMINKDNLQEESDNARLSADSILSVKLLIEKEYNKTILDLDNYKGKYYEVDELLASSKKEVINYKRKIDKLQAENTNVNNLRMQLSHLKQLKESYAMQVTALIKTKEDLENELNTSNKQNLAMKQELSELQRKIESAKFLVANNIQVKWLKVKNNKTKETRHPRRANQLEITFDINSNPFTPVGDKNILVSLYDPKGELVKNSKSGRNFSFAKLFKYEQKPEQVVMYVELQQKPLKGKYKLEVMIDGNTSSKHEFTLIDNTDSMRSKENI